MDFRRTTISKRRRGEDLPARRPLAGGHGSKCPTCQGSGEMVLHGGECLGCRGTGKVRVWVFVGQEAPSIVLERIANA